MTTTSKAPVLVVLQLTGGNDYLNTIVPYTNGDYYDARPHLSIPQDKLIEIDGELGMNPALAPMKQFYDNGSMAIIHGVGYENSVRSHFRSMDIWHTVCSRPSMRCSHARPGRYLAALAWVLLAAQTVVGQAAADACRNP